MTPAPCHRHYNDITWPQERHWKHLEPAITTRGLTITCPPLTITRAQTVKRELRSALLMKMVPWFPNSIAWPLRYIGHLPCSACTCLQITQILDKRDKVTLTLIQILDLKSSGARRSHSVSFEWNLFFLIFSDIIIIQVRGITCGSDTDKGNKNFHEKLSLMVDILGGDNSCGDGPRRACSRIFVRILHLETLQS